LQQQEKLYFDLKQIGADVDVIKKFNPTEKQLRDLRDGLLKLHASFINSPMADEGKMPMQS